MSKYFWNIYNTAVTWRKKQLFFFSSSSPPPSKWLFPSIQAQWPQPIPTTCKLCELNSVLQNYIHVKSNVAKRQCLRVLVHLTMRVCKNVNHPSMSCIQSWFKTSVAISKLLWVPVYYVIAVTFHEYYNIMLCYTYYCWIITVDSFSC